MTKASATTNKETEISQNTKELRKLEKQLKKQNSFSQSFLRGLVTALGATLGVTIVLSIILFIIDNLAKQFGLQGLTDELFKDLK